MINYIGKDSFDLKSYKYVYPFTLEGVIDMENDIKDIISFSISNKIVKYEFIDMFQATNFENKKIDSNMLYISNNFSLAFGYGVKNNYNVHVIDKDMYKSFLLPVNFNCNTKFNIGVFIDDLYCTKLSVKSVFYNVHVYITINEYI